MKISRCLALVALSTCPQAFDVDAACVDNTCEFGESDGELSLLQKAAQLTRSESHPSTALRSQQQQPAPKKHSKSSEDDRHGSDDVETEAGTADGKHDRSGKTSHTAAGAEQDLDALATAVDTESANTTTTTMLVITKNTSASEAAGVSTNGAGDLSAFISAIVANVGTIVVCVGIFAFARLRYPWVYSGNVYDEKYKDQLPASTEVAGEETTWGWYKASMGVKAEEAIKLCGLDHWLLLEFCHMCMKMLGMLAIPNLLLLGPCHMFLGGNRAGDDNLSKLGMANVVDGSNLYWVHCVVVWVSVWIVVHEVYAAMGKFMKWRQEWLMAMPAPRSNTILVEGLPDNQCTDARLKKYFEDMFGGKDLVQEAFCMKHTEKIMNNLETIATLEEELQGYKAKKEETGEEPMFRPWGGGESRPLIAKTQEDIDKLKEENKDEKARIFSVIAEDTDLTKDIPQDVVHLHNNCGFVTFKHRRDAEIAMKLNYTEDEDEFCVSIPPDPSDVIYRDFLVDETREAGSELLGWACVAGLFFGYMPIIVGISSVASLHTLSAHVPAFAYLVEHQPGIAAIWDGLVGAMALTLMVSFLPTFLVIIFYRFFALRAEAWLQHKVQLWYYYFNVIFVLLVTAVGSSLLATVDQLIEDPTSIFKLLADSMPTATHFYLNLYPTQWATHSMILMRYVQWGKFKMFETLHRHEPDETRGKIAHDLAEPEDQDYYGMGSRSARFTIMLVIAIVFCTLSPLMTVLAFINFAFCRLAYGYLFNFAEIIKPDLGGPFFVSQMKHVLQGLFIYITLMAGVLFYRGYAEDGVSGPGGTPGIIAGGAFLYAIPMYNRFDRKFHWVDLPYEIVSKDDEHSVAKRAARRGTYQQPELVEH